MHLNVQAFKSLQKSLVIVDIKSYEQKLYFKLDCIMK